MNHDQLKKSLATIADLTEVGAMALDIFDPQMPLDLVEPEAAKLLDAAKNQFIAGLDAGHYPQCLTWHDDLQRDGGCRLARCAHHAAGVSNRRIDADVDFADLSFLQRTARTDWRACDRKLARRLA